MSLICDLCFPTVVSSTEPLHMHTSELNFLLLKPCIKVKRLDYCDLLDNFQQTFSNLQIK